MRRERLSVRRSCDRHVRAARNTRTLLFFVGENGSGKSTFLEAIAIACDFAAEGGTRNFQPPSRVSANRKQDDAEAPVRRLADALRLSLTKRRPTDGFFLRAETFYDFASHLVRMHVLLTADPRAQFMIATHSPILLAFPGAQISFDGPVLREVGYRETDAYNLTRRFLSDPERMLRRLFEPDATPGEESPRSSL